MKNRASEKKTPGETLKNNQNLLERRVAIYCRIANSYSKYMDACEAQKAILIKEIEKHHNWKLVGIFIDRIAGTSGDTNRREFQKMICQCKAGLIDQILVLSASRIGRNTTEIRGYINNLKRMGVYVTFLKEKIDTADPDYNLITTMFCKFTRREAKEIASNPMDSIHGDDLWVASPGGQLK